MCCFLRILRVRSLNVRRSLGDDRGVAALEGILVFALLAGVLAACMLLGQWGTHLQSAQMGARLLAFDAGDTALARLGRPGNQPSQQSSSASWDTLAGGLPTGWLGTMFALSNDRFSGSVTGTATGRLPSQGRSLFDLSRASMGYRSGSSAASNPWSDTATAVQSTFLGIAYYVGRYRVTPQGLGSVPVIPPTISVLETIYGRVGVR